LFLVFEAGTLFLHLCISSVGGSYCLNYPINRHTRGRFSSSYCWPFFFFFFGAVGLLNLRFPRTPSLPTLRPRTSNPLLGRLLRCVNGSSFQLHKIPPPFFGAATTESASLPHRQAPLLYPGPCHTTPSLKCRAPLRFFCSPHLVWFFVSAPSLPPHFYRGPGHVG